VLARPVTRNRSGGRVYCRPIRFLQRRLWSYRGSYARWVWDEHNTSTRDRFTYIHAKKHEDKIGTGDSHGCARMRDADLAELFMLIDKSTHVIMEE